MISEGDARELLARAAATIDVDDKAPMTLAGLPEPPRRRWPTVVAVAAAVAVVAGLGYGAAQLVGDGATGPAPAASREPVEQEHVYGEDEMPSLLGYSEEEAIAELNERGLLATVSSVPDECSVVPPRHVIGSQPAGGAPVARGETVTVHVVVPDIGTGGLCVPPPAGTDEVFQLLRFARGLGPAPDFPETVSIASGEGDFVELTAEEAADPDSWTVCDDGTCHSPLAALAEAVTRPDTLNGRFAPTDLVVTDNLGLIDSGDSCLTGDPHEQALPLHRPTYVYVEPRHDGGAMLCEPPVLQIGWSEDRKIASVRLRLALRTGEGDLTEPELEDELDSLSADAARQAAALEFVDWARGDGAAPDFADRVRHLDPGFSSRWKEDPERRLGWSGCSGLGFPNCGIDPVGAIARFRGQVEVQEGPSGCGLTPELGSPEDVVHVASRSNPSCRGAVVVELWVDGEGRIYGVRQIMTAAY